MDYIFIIITSVMFLIILKFAWNIKLSNIKKIKEIGYNKKLNEITNKLPENKEICKVILKNLNNEDIEIREIDGKSSFYFVLSNSILIANIKDTFTRVQTISHECLHSIQNRRTLLFNFFFSNAYLIYFFIVCVITIIKFNFFPMLYLFVLTILSFIYYAIRSTLEVDAMTKAKFLAKDYMEKQGSLNEKEQKEIIENYEIINEIGIPLTNFKILSNCILKIIIYSAICILFI